MLHYATDEKTLREGLTFEQFKQFVHTKPVILECFAAPASPVPETPVEAEAEVQTEAEIEQAEQDMETVAETAELAPEPAPEPVSGRAAGPAEAAEASSQLVPGTVPYGVRLSAPGSE